MQWSWVSTAVLRTTENQMKITASLYSFIAFDMVDYLKLNLLFWPRVEKTHAYVHIYGVSFVISVFLWFYYCSVHVCVYGFFLLFASLIFRHINMSLQFFYSTAYFLRRILKFVSFQKKRWKLVGHLHKQIRSDGRWCNTDKIILSTNWFGWLI